MAKLVYSGISSLDGYVADAEGRFDWSMPTEEVHTAINDLERSFGTSLYGRRLYEVMLAWETMDVTGEPDCMRDYAEIWRDTDKMVFSSSLAAVSSTRTTLSRTFETDAMRRLKETAARDMSIGGPHLAAQAIAAGLVDEYHQFLSPIVVGGGTRFFPDGANLNLELVEEQRFGNGVVHLHYRAQNAGLA